MAKIMRKRNFKIQMLEAGKSLKICVGASSQISITLVYVWWYVFPLTINDLCRVKVRTSIILLQWMMSIAFRTNHQLSALKNQEKYEWNLKVLRLVLTLTDILKSVPKVMSQKTKVDVCNIDWYLYVPTILFTFLKRF